MERNRVTRGDWSTFTQHREQVTRLLCRGTTESSRQRSLCVLGAGNGNDLDLSAISECFHQITLVDLDREALDHLVETQASKIRDRVSIASGIDLCGILDRLAEPRRSSNPLDSLISEAKSPPIPRELNRYDVVASTCLLTQLIDAAFQCVWMRDPAGVEPSAEHPRLPELAMAMRDGHLKLLTDLVAPGGRIVLVTDFVSSDTLPELFQVDDAQLGELVSRAINQGNFFTGVNPMVLAHWLTTRPPQPCADVQLHAPWKWQMGNRVYAICGITADR